MKVCFKCGEQKPLEQFHRHDGMRDGHLNKCSACTVKDVAAWRALNPLARKGEYETAIARGKRVRKRLRSEITRDPDAKKRTALRYFHRRRARTVCATEFDVFAFDEALRLAQLRQRLTGLRWSVDHIVPMRHAQASGLHCALNFQVVPFRWNELKKNNNMNFFFPIKHPQTAGY